MHTARLLCEVRPVLCKWARRAVPGMLRRCFGPCPAGAGCTVVLVLACCAEANLHLRADA